MGEALHKYIYLLLVIVLISGCSENSGSSGSVYEPFPQQELSGVWLGSFINTTGVDPYLESTFTVGIITKDGEARFIGDDTQFIADGVYSSLTVVEDQWSLLGQYVQGELDACTWDTTGAAVDYHCTSDLVDDIAGGVVSQNTLWGLYSRVGDDYDYPGILSLVYSSTYETLPNVRDLEGPWVANNVFEHGNTLTLTITPDADEENTTGATINGSDDVLGNNFTGVIVIHYSEDSEDLENVYDVTLSIDGDEDFTGLATYVLERTTQGVEDFKKTLAIGVANGDLSRMISVLSTLGI